MVSPHLHDLTALDRDVALGWTAVSRWRHALVHDGEEVDAEPLQSVRHIAGKSTFEALADFAASASDLPLRDALKRWVFALLLARIGREDEVAWARAASEKGAHYRGNSPRSASWRDAWRGVVSARTTNDASQWLDAAAQSGPRLAGVARARSSRRLEVGRRMGFAHPWDAVTPVRHVRLRQLASQLLDVTEDLFLATWRGELEGRTGAARVLHAAVARDAGEGWPARLTSQWLRDTVGPMTGGRAIDLPPLPRALGASSFMRALRSFGYALRVSAAPRSMPFALARDPSFVSEHRLGFVIAMLALDPQWQARTLGVGARVAHTQCRVLARTALLDIRLQAMRVLLGDDAELAPRADFDELGVRLFFAPLDARLRGAWPTAREDEPGRLVALLQSRGFADRLRDTFDVDWYRNPRAWSHLDGLAAVPENEPADGDTLEGQIAACLRFFEGLLG
ncbi:MAG: hypothetical protein M3O50_04835 [Myxococcota bacterium]|nr:hypothetical protein [Myxococcota bacterium]